MARRKPRTLSDVIARRREHIALRDGYLSLIVRVLALAAAACLLFTQVFLVAQNSGLGMFPALKDGDLMVVFRLQRDYAKNDVVTYRAEGRRYVGRIAAAAGDEVDMDEDGNLTVNGALQTGEILYPTYAGEDGPAYPYTVPEGCVFLLGDYRTQTLDSRDFGTISMENVEGKVITILRRRGL